MKEAGLADLALRDKKVPTLIHVVNVLALLVGGAILSLAAVAWPYQLPIILMLVLVLMLLYVRFRKDPRVAALFFGLSMALGGWIVICEQIVAIDNLLGSRFTQDLRLGVRLRTYVRTTLRSEHLMTLEACCGDALTWHYRPGSVHRWTFDCPTCNKPYETVVDQTGCLNGPPALTERRPLDLILAGDSVLQGTGGPSVVELIRTQLPLRMWNLSIQGYSARQKVNALLTYALPEQPRWLVLEFNAENDLAEAVQDELCASGGNFRCRYNQVELEWRSAHHPLYASMADVRTGIIPTLAYYSAESLTLTITGALVDAIKGAVKQGLGRFVTHRSSRGDTVATTQVAPGPMARPPFPMREGQWPAYLEAGMAAIEREYERLWSALNGMDTKSTVILLYTPAAYELYRGQRFEPLPEMDRTSAFQRKSLGVFARRFDWRWMDLTEPLRKEVHTRQAWLYGSHDQGHWSPEGAAIAASVLATQLSKTIGPHGL